MGKLFRLGLNIIRTQSFPAADTGSNHDLLMITFHLRLKRISEPKHTRLKLTLKSWKILLSLGNLPSYDRRVSLHFSLSQILNWCMQTWIRWPPPSTQQWLKQPVISLAHTARRRNPRSLQIFLICAITGERESWDRSDSNLKNLRNTRNNNIKKCTKNAKLYGRTS